MTNSVLKELEVLEWEAKDRQRAIDNLNALKQKEKEAQKSIVEKKGSTITTRFIMTTK